MRIRLVLFTQSAFNNLFISATACWVNIEQLNNFISIVFFPHLGVFFEIVMRLTNPIELFECGKTVLRITIEVKYPIYFENFIFKIFWIKKFLRKKFYFSEFSEEFSESIFWMNYLDIQVYFTWYYCIGSSK